MIDAATTSEYPTLITSPCENTGDEVEGEEEPGQEGGAGGAVAGGGRRGGQEEGHTVPPHHSSLSGEGTADSVNDSSLGGAQLTQCWTLLYSTVHTVLDCTHCTLLYTLYSTVLRLL